MWSATELLAVWPVVSPALLFQTEGKVGNIHWFPAPPPHSLPSCLISGPGSIWSVRTPPGWIQAWELTPLKIVEVILDLRKYLHATTISKLTDSRNIITFSYLYPNITFPAVCLPECQNGGLCIRPQVCHCGPQYEGSACEHSRTRPCLDSPPRPRNARISCSDR